MPVDLLWACVQRDRLQTAKDPAEREGTAFSKSTLRPFQIPTGRIERQINDNQRLLIEYSRSAFSPLEIASAIA